jgi:hypothetical protein
LAGHDRVGHAVICSGKSLSGEEVERDLIATDLRRALN